MEGRRVPRGLAASRATEVTHGRAGFVQAQDPRPPASRVPSLRALPGLRSRRASPRALHAAPGDPGTSRFARTRSRSPHVCRVAPEHSRKASGAPGNQGRRRPCRDVDVGRPRARAWRAHARRARRASLRAPPRTAGGLAPPGVSEAAVAAARRPAGEGQQQVTAGPGL